MDELLNSGWVKAFPTTSKMSYFLKLHIFLVVNEINLSLLLRFKQSTCMIFPRRVSVDVLVE
jgi:hypothetical protein